jgi:hypothetical protein
MENVPKLGQLVEGEWPRDAVHIAVIPVTVGYQAKPGARVTVSAWSADEIRAYPREDDEDDNPDDYGPERTVGILDPFLREPLKSGDRCWMLLLPGTITSLRHEWSSPRFPTDLPVARPEKSASEKWLREFAELYSIGYDELLEGAVSGEGGCFGDDDGPEAARKAEFWSHLAVVTGKAFDAGHIESTYFRCAC